MGWLVSFDLPAPVLDIVLQTSASRLEGFSNRLSQVGRFVVVDHQFGSGDSHIDPGGVRTALAMVVNRPFQHYPTFQQAGINGGQLGGFVLDVAWLRCRSFGVRCRVNCICVSSLAREEETGRPYRMKRLTRFLFGTGRPEPWAPTRGPGRGDYIFKRKPTLILT